MKWLVKFMFFSYNLNIVIWNYRRILKFFGEREKEIQSHKARVFPILHSK